MAQFIPSIMLNAQAAYLIQRMREELGQEVDAAKIYAAIQRTYGEFIAKAGQPLVEYEPVVDGEPPSSEKMNRVWLAASADLAILRKELDVLRAAIVATHSTVTTEMLKSSNLNARAANKLKTLQLYSQGTNDGVVVFGDYFRNTEFLDLERVAPYERAYIFGEGYVTLAPESEFENHTETASIRVLESSNGFAGNLHELSGEKRIIGTYRTQDDPVSPSNSANPSIIYVEEPVFKAEIDPRFDLSAITDAAPDTWYEYEICKVSDVDRAKAKNYNFAYRRPKPNSSEFELLDWANGPQNGVLKLGLEFDLKSVRPVNNVTYVPFGLEDNANYPVKVSSIQTSADGTDWKAIVPEDIYVGTTPNLPTLRSAGDITIGNAIWTFAERQARYVRVYIEQSQAVTTQIGHVYYVDKSGKRVDRVAPSLTDPIEQYHANAVIVGDNAARREVFTGKRWAIGIRDVLIQALRYGEVSTLITKPLRVGKIVDRVTLEADVTIPDEFDQSQSWIRFYISPDDGVNWHEISRIQDSFYDVPEVIAYNDPIPSEFRETGVRYYNTSEPVTSLRMKIVMERPSTGALTTPILHSYRLKVRTR